MGNPALDAALDRLADMGLAALTRDAIEPLCAAMIAQAGPELADRKGAGQFFAEYWSMARAVASAFDEPQIAVRAAAMFFARAPKSCSAWAKSEMVDGRERLAYVHLRELAQDANSARDRNSGMYVAEMVEAMVARQSDSASRAMDAALSSEPAQAPAALAALRKDLQSSFIWPRDEGLDALIDGLAASAQAEGSISQERWSAALAEIESVAMGRQNHGLSCGFGLKLAARAAREPLGMGLGKERWDELMDHLLDWSDSARHQSDEHFHGMSKGLADIDKRMLSSWSTILGSARERVASELALGAIERAAEPGGEAASGLAIEFLREMFWGRGASLGKGNPESFKSMATALCNRLCRDGAAACLPPAAAARLYDGMATFAPGLPKEWSAATDPRTISWLTQASGQKPDGARWRQIAALAAMGSVEPARQALWAKEIEGSDWGLSPGEESLRDAVSAKALAKGLGGAARGMGEAIAGALGRAGAPDGDALGRLQDLLSSLSDLGASDGACARAERAMAEALAVHERESLLSAVGLGAAAEGGEAPAAPRRHRL